MELKPLEWKDHGRGFYVAHLESFEIQYEIVFIHGCYRLDFNWGHIGEYFTLEDAKAAAMQDLRGRVCQLFAGE